MNSWTDSMYQKWGDILDAAASNTNIACVVLCGSGRCFSAGQDVKELSEYPVGATGAPSFNKMFRSHVQFPKPLIAACHGIAVGWGATLLATCDLVIMSSSAKIRVPFTSLGLAPEGGASRTFPDQLTRQEAHWLLYSSEWMEAADCLRVGLAFKVVADMDLMLVVGQIARKIAAQPIVSLMATKRLIVNGKVNEILAAHDREQEAYANGLIGGKANVEALAALREKRKADFSKL